jgi:hypothetical protein
LLQRPLLSKARFVPSAGEHYKHNPKSSSGVCPSRHDHAGERNQPEHNTVIRPSGGFSLVEASSTGRDYVAGHEGLELRNVDANYPLDGSHRFAEIQPNSGLGDYSRLSCGVGDTQLGRRPGSLGRDACAGDTSRARADLPAGRAAAPLFSACPNSLSRANPNCVRDSRKLFSMAGFSSVGRVLPKRDAGACYSAANRNYRDGQG